MYETIVILVIVIVVIIVVVLIVIVIILVIIVHTCHILPPSEIDLGLCLADFKDLEGKYLLEGQVLEVLYSCLTHSVY